jgi:hypothetical protein
MEWAEGSSHSLLNRQEAENDVPRTSTDPFELVNPFSIPLPPEGSELPTFDPIECQPASHQDGLQTIFYASESGHNYNYFRQGFIALTNNSPYNEFATQFYNQFHSLASCNILFPLAIPSNYEDQLADPFKPTTESATQFIDYSFGSSDISNNISSSLHISDMGSYSDFAAVVVGDAPPKNAESQHPLAGAESDTFYRISTPLRRRYYSMRPCN